MNDILLWYLLGINAVALVLYAVDKWKAKRHLWRIPEATLLLTAALGGGLGALSGMCLFHHKTRKWKFRILVPLCIVLWAILLVLQR